MRPPLPLVLLSLALAGCGRSAAPPAESEPGWLRTTSALSTDLKHPTPLTVAPPDTDSRDNGTAQAGRIAPATSGGGSGGNNGPNGAGTASTGGTG